MVGRSPVGPSARCRRVRRVPSVSHGATSAARSAAGDPRRVARRRCPVGCVHGAAVALLLDPDGQPVRATVVDSRPTSLVHADVARPSYGFGRRV
jgi:hypothetical protein